MTKDSPGGVQSPLESETARNADKSQALVIQWFDTTYSRRNPYKTPQEKWSNGFFKSSKHIWIDWANSHAPSRTLMKKLVHFSTSRKENTLLLLKLRFDYPVDPPLHHP